MLHKTFSYNDFKENNLRASFQMYHIRVTSSRAKEKKMFSSHSAIKDAFFKQILHVAKSG